MNIPTRRLTHGLILLLGLVLIIAGIVTQTKGAPVIGLIIAAVNYQQYRQYTERQINSEYNQPNR
jgi:hypothetical protein